MLNFFLGIVFVEMLLPLMEAIIETIVGLFEIQKGKMSIEVAKINKQIEEISCEEEPERAPAIGFQLPPAREDIDEDEYEEDI